MTRTLKITDTMCAACLHNYDTVEEAVECENLDRTDREVEEAAKEDFEHGVLTEAERDRFGRLF